jgi:hypothetical protein
VAPLARGTLTVSAAPAASLLLLVALANRMGAGGLVFYLFLIGIAVVAAGGLAALARLVDVAEESVPTRLDRIRVGLAAALVPVFLLGATARSPILTEVGDAAPGLAGAAVVLGLLLVAAQLATGVIGKSQQHVRLDRGLLPLDADPAQGPRLDSVR